MWSSYFLFSLLKLWKTWDAIVGLISWWSGRYFLYFSSFFLFSRHTLYFIFTKILHAHTDIYLNVNQNFLYKKGQRASNDQKPYIISLPPKRWKDNRLLKIDDRLLKYKRKGNISNGVFLTNYNYLVRNLRRKQKLAFILEHSHN